MRPDESLVVPDKADEDPELDKVFLGKGCWPGLLIRLLDFLTVAVEVFALLLMRAVNTPPPPPPLLPLLNSLSFLITVVLVEAGGGVPDLPVNVKSTDEADVLSLTFLVTDEEAPAAGDKLPGFT